MIDTTEAPIYVSKKLEKAPTAIDIHNDFILSMDYRVKWDTLIKENNEIPYFKEKYQKNIILADELEKLCDFWNLTTIKPKDYIGDIPFYNQLMTFDFFKKISESDKNDIEDGIYIVSSKDMIFNPYEISHKLKELKEKLRDKVSQLRHLGYLRLYHENQKKFVIPDPIILYKPKSELNLFIVVTAWGAEENLIK